MKFYILFGLLCSVEYKYCSGEIHGHHSIVERRTAGGGNFGGYIGLTTYAPGPFLIKGKNEADISGLNSEGYGVGQDECIGSMSEINAGTSRCNDYYGVTGPTGNDEPQNIRHPCSLRDWQCIKHFLAANSKCLPVNGPGPEPLIIDILTTHVPRVNLSLAYASTTIYGLTRSQARDFYVNSKSGNLVLVLQTNLNFTIPRAYFRYQRRAKESIVLADYVTVQHPGIVFTVVLPKIPQLRLELAEIHADFVDTAPSFVTGPGAVASNDPEVQASYAGLFANALTVVKEALLYQAQVFVSVYIQENLCDFGLNIASA